MRILHVPTDCGNQGPLLSRVEKERGFDSKAIILAQSYIGFKADEVYGTRKLWALFKLEFTRWWALWKALRYDLIHYNFGSSISPTPPMVGLGQHPKWLRFWYALYSVLFGMIDVRILKWCGKTIWVTFQGGDARQGDRLHELFPEWSDYDEEPAGYYWPFLDKIKRWRIKVWDKYADRIFYINPDLGYFLPKRSEFIPYVCIDPKEIKPWDV